MKTDNEEFIRGMELTKSYISNRGFWQVSKRLSRHLGSVEAALLLADLESKRSYFYDRGELDEEGGFFNIALRIEDELFFTEEKRLKLQKQLVEAGLIKVQRKGLPSKNYYYLQDSEIASVFHSPEKSGQYTPEKVPTNKNPLLVNSIKDSNSLISSPILSDEDDAGDVAQANPPQVSHPTSKNVIADLINTFKADNPEYAFNVHKKQPLYNELFETFKSLKIPKSEVKSNMDLIKRCLAPSKSYNQGWSDDVKGVLYTAFASAFPTRTKVLTNASDRVYKPTNQEALDELLKGER